MKVLFKELPYGKKLWLKLMNSRNLEISTDSVITNIELTKDLDRKIKSIVIGESYKIALGSSFTIPLEDQTITYEINDIIKTGENRFICTTHHRNKTTTYLLPILGKLSPVGKVRKMDLSTIKEMEVYAANTYLINAYIDETNMQVLRLLYRFSNHTTYKLLEECLISHPQFIKVTDGFKAREYVIFDFKIDNIFSEDIVKFLNGKYSEFSEELKNRICRFYRLRRDSRVRQVLYKDETLREVLSKELKFRLHPDAELDSVPNKLIEFLAEL